MCGRLMFFTTSSAYLVFTLDLQMSTFSLTYIGFVDDDSHSIWNLSSAAWVIYSPNNELVSIHGTCVDQTTNNIAEYNIVIELLADAIKFGI